MTDSTLASIARDLTDDELTAYADKVAYRLDRLTAQEGCNPKAIEANRNILDAVLNELEERDLPVCW